MIAITPRLLRALRFAPFFGCPRTDAAGGRRASAREGHRATARLDCGRLARHPGRSHDRAALERARRQLDCRDVPQYPEQPGDSSMSCSRSSRKATRWSCASSTSRQGPGLVGREAKDESVNHTLVRLGWPAPPCSRGPAGTTPRRSVLRAPTRRALTIVVERMRDGAPVSTEFKYTAPGALSCVRALRQTPCASGRWSAAAVRYWTRYSNSSRNSCSDSPAVAANFASSCGSSKSSRRKRIM